MKYTVVWTPGAEKALTQLYLDADNRSELTTSANIIDTLLQQTPENLGESRADQSRLLYVRPLAVCFDVSTIDRTVKVWAVWRHPKSTSSDSA